MYKNQDGLEGKFVEDYTNELVALAGEGVDKTALKVQLKGAMSGTLDANMADILARQQRLQKSIQTVEELSRQDRDQMDAELKQTQQMLEDELYLERTHRGTLYESILENQEEFCERFGSVL